MAESPSTMHAVCDWVNVVLGAVFEKAVNRRRSRRRPAAPEGGAADSSLEPQEAKAENSLVLDGRASKRCF